MNFQIAHLRAGLGRLTAFLVVGFSVASAGAEIEPAARALAAAAAAKLGQAQTVKLTAKHKIDPDLGTGSALDKGPLEITVKRPNRFYLIQHAGDATREVAYDGRQLCFMNPVAKHHALESLRTESIEAFADRADERFGFRPPVAELLSTDLSGQLFLHVRSAKITGTEWVGWSRCQRLHFEQDGMTGDVWIANKDKLPRRYLLTFTDLKGQPTWDIRFSKWELNAPVDDSLFSKRPAADSQKVQMLKSR